MIGPGGELSTGFDFNGQIITGSCGVTHENKLFIYGGTPTVELKRQVLQLAGCGLSSIGTIPFNHEFGACDSSNGLIVLCFEFHDGKQCRKATTPLGVWSVMMPSTYDHRATRIAMSPGN